MTDVPQILDDDRQIKAIWMAEHDQSMLAEVGKDGVTRIVAYGEPGETAQVPWLAIYMGEHLHARIKASACEIAYAVQEGETT